jgi:prepilin-type processing-associated H-X9-DG protein
MSASRENLLGYLLEALEPAEMAAVERELESHPELQQQLAALAASLSPLGFPDREEELDGPPRQLAERAIDFVSDTSFAMSLREKPARLSPAAPSETLSGFRRISWADCIVAASVLLAAAALLFPAIASSRQNAQIIACQNNLRQIGQALEEYSSRAPDQRIPVIPLRGNRAVAGIYAALLKDSSLLPSDQALVCPSSDLAQQVNTEEPFQVPTLAEIDRAFGVSLVKLQRTLGGSYGYNLGFVEEGKHRAPKMQGRSTYAIMSDAPNRFEAGRQSKNHGRRGANMLYADNHVQFVTDLAHDLLDDPFHNRSGIIAAGEDSDDMVLGESSARPMPTLLQTVER